MVCIQLALAKREDRGAQRSLFERDNRREREREKERENHERNYESVANKTVHCRIPGPGGIRQSHGLIDPPFEGKGEIVSRVNP